MTPLGPDRTSLISNVPVRHFTTVFRPQFWGFFVFAAGLRLFVVLAVQRPPSVDGRLLTAAALDAVEQDSGVRRAVVRVLAQHPVDVLVAVAASRDDWAVLHRHLRGVLHVRGSAAGLLVGGGGVRCRGGEFRVVRVHPPSDSSGLARRGSLRLVGVSEMGDHLHPRCRAPTILALGGAWLVVAVVMAAFYHDAEAALVTIANTVYPGRRSSPAGGYPVLALFSHWFSLWESDQRIPQGFANICECAGFFWLAPVTLFALRGVKNEPAKIRAYWILTAFGALLFIWMTLPVPHAIGRALLLDKSRGGRMVHVLGLVNVILVALSLSFCRPGHRTGRRLAQTGVLGAAVFSVVSPVLLLTNVALANFLTNGELLIAVIYATVLVVAVVENRFAVLAACLLLPQLAIFGLVNPVDRGLQVVETSPLFQVVRSRPELLRHGWIVYSESFPDSTFFTALGCQVVNGLKYVPDLKAFRVLDPTGAQKNLVNRSAWLIAEPVYANRPATFEHVPPTCSSCESIRSIQRCETSACDLLPSSASRPRRWRPE